MPPTPIITETPSHHLHIRPLYIALITPFIIAGLAYAFIPSLRDGLGMLLHPVDDPTEVSMSIVKPELLAGTISLTLARAGEAMGPYQYDIETGEGRSLMSAQGTDYFGGIVSPDGSKIAVSSAPRTKDHSISLWVGDSEMTDLTSIGTEDTLDTIEATSWSADSAKVALVGRTDGMKVDPNDSSVYVHDTVSGMTEYITNGAEALFTPLGTLLVLKNDGIHHVDPVSGEDTLVDPMVDGQATENMTLALSSDGKMLAWALPNVKKVYVIELSSLSPYTTGAVSEIEAVASDVAFSPKGEYLVAIESSIDTADDGTARTTSNLMAHGIASQELHGLMNLDGYTTSSINFWR